MSAHVVGNRNTKIVQIQKNYAEKGIDVIVGYDRLAEFLRCSREKSRRVSLDVNNKFPAPLDIIGSLKTVVFLKTDVVAWLSSHDIKTTQGSWKDAYHSKAIFVKSKIDTELALRFLMAKKGIKSSHNGYKNIISMGSGYYS